MKRSTIKYEKRAACAWITLDRPQVLNVLNATVLRELGEALDEIEHDPEIRCLVVTGTGQGFCAGADLKFINDLPDDAKNEAIAQFLSDINALMLRIEALALPVIAAVNGITVGGGLELLLSCDLVVAAEGARLADGHANFGLLPGAGASVRLPRKLGLTPAKYLLFTGDLIAAGDPIFGQLINRVVPDEQLQATAEQLAERIARKSPLGLSHMKALANAAFDVSLESALALEQSANKAYAASYDRNEGIAAFNEHRKPVFLGR